MAVYQALVHQQQAAKALITARRGTADMAVRISEMIKQGVDVVNTAYYTEEMDKYEEAQRCLISALDNLEQASRNGMLAARSNVTRLREMSEQLRDRQEKLRGANQLASLETGTKS